MKNSLQRVMTLLAVAAMLAAGCGGSSDGDAAATDDTEATEATTAESTDDAEGDADTDTDTDGDADTDAGADEAAADVPAECAPLEQMEDVTLGLSRNILAFAPVFLAIENGNFEAANLNVTIEPLNSSEALAPIGQGRIDGSLTSYSVGHFNAYDSGVELQWVMPGYYSNEDSKEGYWVRVEDAGTEDAPDIEALRGATFGSPTGGTGAGGLILAKALEPAGMSLGDIELTQLSGTDVLVALENGAISGGWLSDPIWQQAEDNPDLRFFATYPPGVNGSGLVAGPRLLERPQVLVNFLKVVGETIDQGLTGPDHLLDEQTAAYLADAFDSTPEEIMAALPLGYDATNSLDGGAEYLDTLQGLMMDQGFLEYDTPIAGEDLIDASFGEIAAACG